MLSEKPSNVGLLIKQIAAHEATIDRLTLALSAASERAESMRAVLETIQAEHQQDGGAPFCHICGAEGGRYPCATTLEVRAALNDQPLPQPPQTQTQEPR